MYGLLTLEESILNLRDNVFEFFSTFSVAYAVEILLFFGLIYYVSKILRENDGTRLMFLYWVLIVVVGVMQYSSQFEFVGAETNVGGRNVFDGDLYALNPDDGYYRRERGAALHSPPGGK